MRLRTLKKEFGNRVNIEVKAFPLRPHEEPQRLPSPYLAKAFERYSAEGKKDGLSFQPWPKDQYMPSSSMPAQAAAKCAALQGEEPFSLYELALFHAYFEERRDISQREVLLSLADQTGLDRGRLAQDMDSRDWVTEVLKDHQECVDRFGPWATGVPLQSFDGGLPLVGCAPMEIYRASVVRRLNPLPAPRPKGSLPLLLPEELV